ncbi:MAG: UDP-N-acetylglucosamine 2-epimerase (hydrolyzing), partial [Muribaculaceae bacterium]|nr:UDP-N-acetylglucosamine 2-epimerase (hydrolyzing) [Muribaculaceae bacterium]
IQPDAVLLLGDRYEMLAVASAAAIMRIPVIHIAGGAVSEGAVDDCIRHAITKLSSLHLTETEEYRRRVIQMGEQPDTVVNTGAIGVWNGRNITPVSKESLEEFLGMQLDGETAIVTYHPATNDTSATPAEQVEAMLEAIAQFPDLKCVITYPNNDAGGASTIPLLEKFAATHTARVRLVPSLGMLRYQSMLKIASLVIGNSSSGIVEVPSAGISTVDIGIRQQGRTAAQSVIHCGNSCRDISEAISEALSPAMKELASKCENPYYRPDTLALMRNAVLKFMHSLPVAPKKFYNIDLNR